MTSDLPPDKRRDWIDDLAERGSDWRVVTPIIVVVVMIAVLLLWLA